MQKSVLYFLIFLIVILIFWNPAFFIEFKKKLFNPAINEENKLLDLQKENLILKEKLAELSGLDKFLKLNNLTYKLKPAFIYSRYPFNLKNEILINLGEKDNVSVGKIVVLPQKDSSNFILVGKIQKVYKNFSLAQTVFDPNFKLAVKIGEKKYDGFFVGGPNPKINLIPADAQINIGDVVYSADSNLPYGIIVAEIFEIKNVQNSLFKEAVISIPYDLNKINLVGVLEEWFIKILIKLNLSGHFC